MASDIRDQFTTKLAPLFPYIWKNWIPLGKDGASHLQPDIPAILVHHKL